METKRLSCRLSAGTIDYLSEMTNEVLSEAKTSRRNVLRLRLSVEEVLLQWLKTLGEGAPCTFRSGKRLGRRYITLSVVGKKVNPFEIEDGLDFGNGDTKQSILANLGLAPSYNYLNGENQITLMPKKEKRNPLINLLGAVVLAVIFGFLGYLLPGEARLVLSENILTPIFETFMGFLAAMAGPMIFFSVLWGIYSIGDTATLGKIGKKMIGRFILFTYVSLVLAFASFVWFFDISLTGGGTGSNGMWELYSMVLDIIPSNMITPFVEGNSLQIIFIAIIFGLALLILGNKVTVAAQAVEQLNYIVQLIMEALTNLIPIFIFVSLSKMILSDVISTITSTVKPIILVTFSSLAILFLFIAAFAVIKKISFMTVAGKLLPTFMIGITTASSSAAFPSNVEICEKKFGIDSKITSFGLPLGSVVFMPASATAFFIIAVSIAETFKVTISVPWLLVAILLSGILAIAAPPVPGGALVCYTVLFTQLGIPLEGLTFAITIDIIIDFVCTAGNITSLPVVLAMLASKLDMMDEGILRGERPLPGS